MNRDRARRSRRACLLAVALVWYGEAARAGDAPTAEALFRAGREASERGDAKVACERFGESYRLDAAPGTLLNIAVCEEALHRLADAWESYQHVAESLAPDDDRLALVKERLAALDSRLARLTLEGTKLGPSAEVLRDGVRLGSGAFGVPLPVDAGEHRILVRAPGRKPREYAVHVSEGARVSLNVEPGEALPKEPPHRAAFPSQPPVSHSLRRDAGFALVGAGAAALVTAGFTGAFYLDASSTANDHCPTSNSCDDEGLKAAGSADRLQVATLVTGAVAIAALAGGITLLIVDNHARERARPVAAVSFGVGTLALRLPL